MNTIEWRPKASADLLEIIAYIAAENPNAAQALKKSIDDKVAALADHPKRCRPGRIKGTRELVAHPNYIVLYRISGKIIEILRVKHAKQKYPKIN